jgi:catechol 2,3-dioxygenase-like lactoylglutathione lyase family enzyme
MLDHISLRVQDFERALDFYKTALAPIGYDVIMEYPGAVGLGKEGKPDFWIMKTEQPLNPTHVAFISDRSRIDAFHSAAISAGGSDNGPPGVRVDYHPHYYAAFVYDPEGNNIEVVCHEDPSAPKPAPARASAQRASRKPAKKAAARTSKKAKPKKAPRAKAKAGKTKAQAKTKSKSKRR